MDQEGPPSLALYAKVITVNLVGSFNMIRLTAEAMSKNGPGDCAKLVQQIITNDMLNAR